MFIVTGLTGLFVVVEMSKLHDKTSRFGGVQCISCACLEIEMAYVRTIKYFITQEVNVYVTYMISIEFHVTRNIIEMTCIVGDLYKAYFINQDNGNKTR